MQCTQKVIDMTETVLIMGAGAVAGVGGALAKQFSDNGYHIVVALSLIHI